ncbi:MAG TPA: hypothetical protein VNO82_04305, partial [Solirubrobacteraceae bacterium]|nr:hypothetical protein [Solirubrobacteraceae bacterium]
MRRRAGIRVGILLGIVLAMPATAHAQELVAPFDRSYSLRNVGTPPGVPARLGGLTLKAGTTDRLLIGGQANESGGALYEIGLTRDAEGHISGFSDTAVRVADAANNDGGVVYGPGGVLFLARWPNNELGQTRPGSAATDKVVNLAALGVTASPGAILFTPPGYPGAGSFKLSGYSDGQWYDADVVPDGAGTYDVANLRSMPGLVLEGGPEGIAYVPFGSPRFGGPSLLVSEYRAGNVATYEVGGNGDPVLSTRRVVVSGLSGAEGALVDPVTGDFVFSTFGGPGSIVVVRGFRAPPPELPPPVAGESVNAFTTRGTVRVKRRGGRFVTLGPGRQIPVGTTVDTLRGRVTIAAAGDQTATFYDGVFRLGQGRGAKPLTTLRLVERLRCPSGGRASTAAKDKKKRRLWGDGSGKFRTDGRYSSATVRGTRWLVEDRCANTLTKVTKGRVAVRDKVRRKTVIVRAGKRYVAERR